MADNNSGLEQLASSGAKTFDKAGFLRDVQEKYRLCLYHLRLDLVSRIYNCTEISISEDVIQDAYGDLASRRDMSVDSKLNYFFDIRNVALVSPKVKHAQKFYEHCLEEWQKVIMRLDCFLHVSF